MKLAIIGVGYVGLTSAAVFSDLGHTVYAVMRNEKKMNELKAGRIPIYEPGLEEMVKKNVAAGRLISTLNYTEAVPEADVIFLCVGTPSLPTGEADLSQVETAARTLAPLLKKYVVIVNKSTVPVGTAERVRKIIQGSLGLARDDSGKSAEFDMASCPEFLREGTALKDTQEPDRIVIGTDSERAKKLLLEVHEKLPGERVLTNIKSAEMIKYASNAFLATKISFINEIANVCEQVGADVEAVAYGMGLDKRIGRAFLKAGLGWGGSCFPKDVRALHNIAITNDYDFKLLKAVIDVNNDQRYRVVTKVRSAVGGNLDGQEIAVLGLAFKPDTDDIRDSAAISIVRLLLKEGARVRVYDPVAMENSKLQLSGVIYSPDAYSATAGVAAVVLATEWTEFKNLDWQKVKAAMTRPVLVDGRNMFDPEEMRRAGWEYFCVGRS